jgi:hypothetical protein
MPLTGMQSSAAVDGGALILVNCSDHEAPTPKPALEDSEIRHFSANN